MYSLPQSYCMSSVPTPIHPLLTRLREETEARGLTQAQLACELGVSERTVAYWMNEDVTPQKRLRPVIVAWLDRSAA